MTQTASVKPDSEYLVPEVELRVCVCVCVWFCEDITGAGSSMCESECVNICLTPPLWGPVLTFYLLLWNPRDSGPWDSWGDLFGL